MQGLQLLLQRCTSDSIVTCFGSFIVNSQLWVRMFAYFGLLDGLTYSVVQVLMDYCAWGSLRDALQAAQRPLKEREIAAVCAAAVKGKVPIIFFVVVEKSMGLYNSRI